LSCFAANCINDTRFLLGTRLKILAYILVLLFVLLQIQLWFGQHGALRLWSMKRDVVEQEEENRILRQRNDSLHAEVNELKDGTDALEERARSTLGMIREGEEFYQAVPGTVEPGKVDPGKLEPGNENPSKSIP
jgi:cell division protein FtsB